MAGESQQLLYGADHVRRYEETDGAVGHDWKDGAPILILTTVGAKTGAERKHALIYQEVDGKYVIVASLGGAPEHPQWYRNLLAQPEVKVQVKGDKFTAKARTADGAERDELWRAMAAVWPDYDAYQKRTDRVIPIVVLDRV
jgi:deazaflavin-dependent oxidoreductase (nitroreductase family)